MFKKLIKVKKEVDETNSHASHSPKESKAETFTFHVDAGDDGGLVCNNDQLLKQQTDAIVQHLKTMGKGLMSGKLNLINTSFPVTMFEPRSYLEKLADVWVYPKYLTEAAATSDPLERINLVVTWFVAGLHHAFENWRKPFNPLLGETWEATLSDGSEMFMEQISHHPPISAFHLHGPGGAYQFRGLSQPTVSLDLRRKGFKTVAQGFRYIEFADGGTIEIFYPVYCIRNVVYAGRPRAEVEGQAFFVDPRNRLQAVVNFGHLRNAKSKVLRRSDAVHGFVYDFKGREELSYSGQEDRPPGSLNHEGRRAVSNTSQVSSGDEGDGESHHNRAPGLHSPSTGNVAVETSSPKHGNCATSSPTAAEGGGENDSSSSEELESASSENEWEDKKSEDLTRDSPGYLQGEIGQPGFRRTATEVIPVESLIKDLELKSTTRRPVSSGLDICMSSLVEPSYDDAASSPSRSPSTTKAAGAGAATTMTPPPSASNSTHSSSFFGGALKQMGGMLNLLPTMQSPITNDAVPLPSEAHGTPVCSLEGSWLSHLDVNHRRRWNILEKKDTWTPVSHPLPSDGRFREDIVALTSGDVKGAQRAKEKLEVQQRKEKRLRDVGRLSDEGASGN